MASDVWVTEHAADRWDERTGPASVAPETAWTRAPRSAALLAHLTGDEARYYRPQDVVLVRSGPAVATVLDVAAVERRAIEQTVREQFGTPEGVA